RDSLLTGFGEYDIMHWRLYRYDQRFIETNASDVLLPGRAYWLRTKSIVPNLSHNPLTAISPPVSGPFVVPLNGGWNCIATPFLFNVPKESLRKKSGPVTVIYSYVDEEWIFPQNISYLEPWMGYVIWTSDSTGDTLSIPPVEYTAPASPSSLLKSAGIASGNVEMTVTSASGKDGRIAMGYGYVGAIAGKDNFDVLKPELWKKPVSVHLSVNWESRAYLTDFRARLGNGQRWLIRLRSDKREMLNLEFSGITTLPVGMKTALLQRGTGVVVKDIPEEYAYLPKKAGESELEFVIGTEEYIEDMVGKFAEKFTPFALSQNIPNPWNIQTKIQYHVPESSRLEKVELVIFDLNGKKVKSLMSTLQSAGSYSCSWDGKDDTGTPVNSGTYVYRLKIGNSSEKRKMVLTK
ncbi:MAG: T9SS type A sorting domain-containing protein, partial [Fibrobacteria bacterium]|nr:T9SS type A sorting domain-containing protein [Fibrobacteria bacterium]